MTRDVWVNVIGHRSRACASVSLTERRNLWIRGLGCARWPASGGGPATSDVIDDVTDRLEALQILVRDPDGKRVLGRDGQVDQRKRVDTEILLEALVPGHRGPIHLGDLLEKPGEDRLDVVLLHSLS